MLLSSQELNTPALRFAMHCMYSDIAEVYALGNKQSTFPAFVLRLFCAIRWLVTLVSFVFALFPPFVLQVFPMPFVSSCFHSFFLFIFPIPAVSAGAGRTHHRQL